MAKKAYAGNEKNIRSVRFEAIKRIIMEEQIGSQQELLKRLNEEGYDVTQGTVSRDIRDLKLTRVALPGGGHRFEESKIRDETVISNQFRILFRTSVTKIDTALNQVVIKTYSGMAGAVCASMDSMQWEGMLGTIAGDDTILVIMRTQKDAEELSSTLSTLRSIV
ncbi:MAG: arginine repressor [Clostridia bacterium]|nr:arginine repressor [Clostridia bacterium]MBO7504392.1 arginine repressor [Clostridia bacterium]